MGSVEAVSARVAYLMAAGLTLSAVGYWMLTRFDASTRFADFAIATEALELFDEYKGDGVEPGFRSLAWRLTFRHPQRTLRDKEIEGRRSRILAALQQELHVRQRST